MVMATDQFVNSHLLGFLAFFDLVVRKSFYLDQIAHMPQVADPQLAFQVVTTREYFCFIGQFIDGGKNREFVTCSYVVYFIVLQVVGDLDRVIVGHHRLVYPRELHFVGKLYFWVTTPSINLTLLG